MNSYYNELIKLKREGLQEFASKLIPNNNKPMLGVSTKDIKNLAKKILSTGMDYEFISSVPHKYYEEDMLHGVILGLCKVSYDKLINEIERFLPFVDNWAICDSMAKNKKILINNKERYFQKIVEWIKTEKTYYIRFGLLSLMSYYISYEYNDHIFALIGSINNHDYYVDMMISWLLATMMIEFKNDVINVLKSKSLNNFIIRKTISKSIESFRIDDSTKNELKELRKLLL